MKALISDVERCAFTKFSFLFVMFLNNQEHRYDDEKGDVKEFMESIDQLAMAFSSR